MQNQPMPEFNDRLDQITHALRMPRRLAQPPTTQRDAKRLLRLAARTYQRTHNLHQRACAQETGMTLPLGDVQGNAHQAQALLVQAQALPLTRAGLRARELAWDNDCVAGDALAVATRGQAFRVAALPALPPELYARAELDCYTETLREVRILERDRKWIQVQTSRETVTIFVPPSLHARLDQILTIHARLDAPPLTLRSTPRRRQLRDLYFEP